MQRGYLAAAFVIFIDALAIAIVSAILAMIYWLATGASGELLPVIINLLFLEGGIILTFGALLELFKLKGTKEIHKFLYAPQRLLDGLEMAPKPDKDGYVESYAGWTLIFIGATLVIFSFVISLEYII